MEPQPSGAVEIFCSYAHEDESLRKKLEAHLGSLKREGKIKNWHDRMIPPGENWKDRLDKQLETAHIILLLVSSDFINSDYCHEVEMRRALERHRADEARALPIILRPCDWENSQLGELQALPEDARPVTEWPNEDAAFRDIAKSVRSVVDELLGAASPASIAPPSIPRPPTVGFVARRDEGGQDVVKSLKTELAPGRGQFVALCGPGGVGKTTLAAEAARTLSKAFSNRVAWVSADGLPEFALTTLLDAIAAQFGQTGLRPLPVAQKAERVRSLVTQKPTLVVLDNFETIKPEERTRCAEWLGECASCSALVTSRVDVPGARPVYIKVMSPPEAKEFLKQLINPTRNPQVFRNLDHDQIIDAAGRNPLVLQWVIKQIDKAQQPRVVLSELAQGKGDAAQRVFDRSFDLLSDDGRAALLALSLFAPSASRPALAGVAGFGANKGRLNEAAAQLAELWLVGTTEGNERLTVEGLTRELSKSHLSESEHAAEFRRRFIAHFLTYAEAHAQPTPEDLNALESERDNLLSAVDVAFEAEDWDSVLRICWALNEFLSLRGYWDKQFIYGEKAIEAAKVAKEAWYIGAFANDLGSISTSRGDYDLARNYYIQAEQIARQLNEQQGLAATLHELGILAQSQGELEEARRLYSESLEIKKRLGNQSGIAITLHELGRLAQRQGDLDEARRLYTESLEIGRRLGDQSGIAITLHELGRLAQLQRDLDEARRLYNESLEINERLGNQSGIALTFGQLGRIAEEEGDTAEAARMYREALRVFERLRSPYAKLARQDLERVERAAS